MIDLWWEIRTNVEQKLLISALKIVNDMRYNKKSPDCLKIVMTIALLDKMRHQCRQIFLFIFNIGQRFDR